VKDLLDYISQLEDLAEEGWAAVNTDDTIDEDDREALQEFFDDVSSAAHTLKTLSRFNY
jgi:hypothetical protein